jgi:hypothetical protein
MLWSCSQETKMTLFEHRFCRNVLTMSIPFNSPNLRMDTHSKNLLYEIFSNQFNE